MVKQFVLFGAFLFLFSSVAAADIVILSDDGDTNFDTGAAGAGKLIQVFIAETPGSNHDLEAIVARFDLQAGTYSMGVVSDPGSTGTAGFFGAGKFDTSEFNNIDADTLEINQLVTAGESLNTQSAPGELWFEFTLDTTGLADGVYNITLQDPNGSFADPAFNFIPANEFLTFTVSSIPEPSGGLATLAGLLIFASRRRRSSFAKSKNHF